MKTEVSTMRTHTKTFHIRFTEKEYEQLCKYADKAGLPKTTYIRQMINGCRPKERPDMDFLEFKQGLYHLGNNLNQIAHLAHKFGSFHEARLQRFYEQYIAMVKFIAKRMVAPDDLDISATLECGRQFIELEKGLTQDE
jgi:hypothetical protein